MTTIESQANIDTQTVLDSTALFEKALNSWSAIDLSSLQKELDSKALEIQNYQKESLLDRKDLATQTKDFKKLEDNEKINKFNQLLKSYQNVIDSMNKKNKNVETLFFKIYRSIAEAPDPKPLLKSSLENITTSLEVDKLKEDNKLLEEKLLKFADYDKLKEQIEKTEIQMKSINEAEIKAKENEWKSLLEEKKTNWQKDEKDKILQIDILRKQIQEHELNEKMLKLKLKKKSVALGEDDYDDDDEEEEEYKEETKEETSNIKSVELENLKNDFETSQKRIKSLENRNEDLRREVSLLNSNIAIEIQKTKKEDSKQINNLEGENSLLIAKLEYERKENKNLKNEINSLKINFDRDSKYFEEEIKDLKNLRDIAANYEDVKKELEILKQIQFGDDELEEEEEEDGGEGKNGEKDNQKEDKKSNFGGSNVSKLESAIVQRNKKLNNDLTELRRENEEKSKKLSELTIKITQFEDEINKLKDSNSRLETDLMNFDNNSSNTNNDRWETMSMISSVAGSQTNLNKGKVSPAASIAGGDVSNSTLISNNGSDISLLPIITQQRDRFRNRNKELEEENKKQYGKTIELKREINSLKMDNRELYEKIRFLEHHQNIKNNSIQVGGDIENKYKSEYENDLHPIEQFRIMETKRINSKISPWERIFIQITRTVLSTSVTRWLFVGYCLSLHLLVMILTLSMLGNSSTPTVVSHSGSAIGGGPGKGSLGKGL
ncbi:hypothetical protein C6P40_002069 [Pichia californica]|uniref:Protein CASP n=1 Tax=Pichia californica TaxID=460514 RepID=A0A9P6WI90_9ASCO|nr:hypothetical protein C6P40_002069 [[Candida] californica]